MNKKSSFTSTDPLSLKILLDGELVESMQKDKKILPRHIQLNIENTCTQNCSWCSTANRNKTLEMPYEKIMKVMEKFKSLGTKGCTIAGCGEFLCHPRANDIISGIYNLGIDVGLVTNGDLINKLGKEDLEKIIWIRISFGDGKKTSEDFWKNLSEAIEKGENVDWGCSYVIANEKPDYSLIKEIVEFSNCHNLIYIRIVNDIFNADKLRGVMKLVKKRLKEDGIDDSLVIYQDRSEWTKGIKKCPIGLLKPVITPDGKLSPCCADNCKDNPPSRDFVGDWGTIEDIDEIWEEQKCYDGSKCVKCFYSNYNTLLLTLLEKTKHLNFI